MTKAEAARRYLQADMDANYTGLPGEAKDAHEETKKGLERRHPGVQQHATVGSDQDFDRPLTAGQREHQRHMRQAAGLQHADVLAGRKEIRGGSRPKPTRPTPKGKTRPTGGARAAVRAGTNAGRAFYRSRPIRDTGIPSTVTSTGSTVMKAIGLGIGLCLVYLVLNEQKGGKGPVLFASVLNALVGLVRTIVAPVDPFTAAAAKSATASSTTPATVTPAPGPPVPAKAAPRHFRLPSEPSRGTITTPIGG